MGIEFALWCVGIITFFYYDKTSLAHSVIIMLYSDTFENKIGRRFSLEVIFFFLKKKYIINTFLQVFILKVLNFYPRLRTSKSSFGEYFILQWDFYIFWLRSMAYLRNIDVHILASESPYSVIQFYFTLLLFIFLFSHQAITYSSLPPFISNKIVSIYKPSLKLYQTQTSMYKPSIKL